MFLLLAGMMFLAAAATYLGMHRGLRAASAPPLMQILAAQMKNHLQKTNPG